VRGEGGTFGGVVYRNRRLVVGRGGNRGDKVFVSELRPSVKPTAS